MAIYRFSAREPKIGKNSFISDSAIVIGDVVIGDDCYIGHGVILRGDYGSIHIGNGSAIEEGANLHIRPNDILKIGEMVTVGHGAIIHCSTIKSYAVIGLGSVIGFDAVIGEWSIVAEASFVKKNTLVPDGKIVAGSPAKVIKNVSEENRSFWLYAKELYINLAHQYIKPGNFVRLD